MRQARSEAGLSLAAVAGDELTRAAIHLIEVGKSRPSVATLKLIAERTAKPMTYFLEETALTSGTRPTDRSDIDEVDDHVERSEYAAAIELGGRLLRDATEIPDIGRLELALANAYVLVGQPDKALEHASRAVKAFESIDDSWLLVESLDWEAFSLHLTHRPGAMELAEMALRRCRDLDPLPSRTEARILGHLGAIHLHHHRWDEGLSYLEAALSASSLVRDLKRMAAINHDLAIAHASRGTFSESLSRAHRALNLYCTLHDLVGMALIENDLGVITFMQGDIARAYPHFLSALAHFEDAGVESRKSHVYLSLAELHMARGSDYEAEQSCDQAASLAARLGEHRNLALAHEYLGQIAVRRGMLDRADAEFELAISILEENGATQRAIECRVAFADVLEERGDLTGANRQLRAALNGRQQVQPAAALRTASA